MIRPEELGELTVQQQRELLQRLLSERAAEGVRFPMSVQQQGLWYDYRTDSEGSAFNVFMPSRVRSELDVDSLRNTVETLVSRHACLRTTFSDTGGHFMQQVHDDLPPEFQIVPTETMDEAEVHQRVMQETQRPFDLENGPLLRMTLFRRSKSDWIVLAMSHHIVVDFWSLVLILTDARGDSVDARREASCNYAQFVKQQRDTLNGPRGDVLRRYWTQQLNGASSVVELPTDFIRPEHFSRRAEVVSLDFGTDLTNQMSTLATQSGATFQSLVLAILQTMIHRYTGQESFHIGSPFSGRLHSDYENTVGFFVNMLPLRADVSADLTFAQLVQQASKTMIDALQHEDLPLSEIVRMSGVPRDVSRSPLFQVSCTFEKSHLRSEQGRAAYLIPSETQRANTGGMEQESYSIPVQTCHYDLELVFEKGDDGLHGMICYCRDLFDKESMEVFAERFQQLAAQLLAHPNRPLSEVSWRVARNEPCADLPGKLSPQIVNSIDRAAEQAPDDIALLSSGVAVTYRSLVDESEAIARALACRGIGRGDYVPVVGNLGQAVIPAILGVIRSGAAVVPIDASQPAVSPRDLLSDTQARVVIVENVRDWTAPDDPVDGNNPTVVTIDQLVREGDSESITIEPPRVDDLCYLIYTSGSSGRPKGVMVEHRAIDNTLMWRSKTAPVSSDDRVMILLSHQFDAGFGLVFSSLVQGATLVWSDQSTSDVDAIVDRMIGESITVLPMIPTMLTLIVDHPKFTQCSSLRQVWTGGETMPADLALRLRHRHPIPLWNFYGPTEAAVEATAGDVIHHDPRRIVPIGRPVSNMEILVLDEHQRPLPSTVPGELAIAGPGLARGYLGRVGLTTNRFPRLSDGRRVFLTGDRGRERTDGTFEFFGRTDHQVKLGGYRIELEEIEQVLRSCPSVTNAAVAVKNATPPYLVAYVTGSQTSDESADQLRDEVQRFAAARLPSFKRPRHYQVLSSLPKTTSGKIDRAQLPEISDQAVDPTARVAPRSRLECHLSEAWGSMLGIANVGIYHDFFELGGTSLQAAMMASRLSEELEIHVPTSLLFDLADISRLAERLSTLHRDEIEIRFGAESIDLYEHSSVVDAGSNEIGSHPLIAELRPGVVSDLSGEAELLAPIFMVHPPGGIVVCYRELAQRVDANQSFYAIRSRGLHGAEELPATAELMAADYVKAIQRVRPSGPYQLGGWSLGGIVAYEVARQLKQAGEEIERLILLDTAIPVGATDLIPTEQQGDAGSEYGIEMSLDELAELNPAEQLPLLWEHAKSLGVLDDDAPPEVIERALEDLKHLFHHHVNVVGKYKIEPLDIPLLLIRPQDVPFESGTPEDRGWSALVPKVKLAFVPGHHHSMVQPPNVDEVAKLLKDE